ncbi:MAG TPA: ion transporter [Flavisolibacter sp.]|jgi:voltage-gated potassium channel|nr:ion transporter [Flavisolibacter sp.]HZI01750.1 ion transporter [Flavisolibacter sp.]
MHISFKQKQALHPFNIVIFVLSSYVVIALLVDAFVDLSPEFSKLLHEIDYFICFFFFIDFLIRFFTAKSKLEYMRWGWIDLISSIPVFDFFLAGRMFRIIQLLRVIRAFRSMNLILKYFFKNKVQGAFTSVGIVAILMIIFSAIGILGVEKDAPGSNIRTAEDALWWSYVTITTVGYGDRYPVTSEGRLIAAALMTVGVGLFGMFTAYVASWFVVKRDENNAQKTEPVTKKEETIIYVDKVEM